MVARRKPLLSQKNMTPQHQTNHKTSGIITFGQTRPTWRCLTRMHSALFGEKQMHSILAQTPHTNCEAQWWKYNGLGLSNSLSLAKTWESATTITTQTNQMYNSWIYLLQINLPAKYLPGLSLQLCCNYRNPATPKVWFKDTTSEISHCYHKSSKDLAALPCPLLTSLLCFTINSSHSPVEIMPTYQLSTERLCQNITRFFKEYVDLFLRLSNKM